MNLSQNFTLQELIKSDTAIRKGIDNNPNSDQVEKLKALCENVLQPVEIISEESRSRQDIVVKSYVKQSVALKNRSMQKLRRLISNV